MLFGQKVINYKGEEEEQLVVTCTKLYDFDAEKETGSFTKKDGTEGKYFNMNVAVTVSKEHSEFFRIVIFDKSAEIYTDLGKKGLLNKGSRFVVVGRPENREVLVDGEPRIEKKIIADRVEVIKWSKDANKNS